MTLGGTRVVDWTPTSNGDINPEKIDVGGVEEDDEGLDVTEGMNKSKILNSSIPAAATDNSTSASSSSSSTMTRAKFSQSGFGVVGPFGKALPRGVEYKDKHLVNDEVRLSACENWRITESNGKTNMRLRLVDTFGPDVNGPAPMQYMVSHKHNSRIEGVSSSRIVSRPKPPRSIKTAVGSGKLVYDFYGGDYEKWKPGPRMVGVPNYDHIKVKKRATPSSDVLYSTTRKKFDSSSSSVTSGGSSIDTHALSRAGAIISPSKHNGVIKKPGLVMKRKTLELSNLWIREKYNGAIENVRDQSLLTETRPSPMDYTPKIDATRPTSAKHITIGIKCIDKGSNTHRPLMNGHHIPGPGSYDYSGANTMGLEEVTPLPSKNLRDKPIDKSNFSVAVKTSPIKNLNPNYVSDYSFPKPKAAAHIVARGGISASSISLAAESSLPWFH